MLMHKKLRFQLRMLRVFCKSAAIDALQNFQIFAISTYLLSMDKPIFRRIRYDVSLFQWYFNSIPHGAVRLQYDDRFTQW